MTSEPEEKVPESSDGARPRRGRKKTKQKKLGPDASKLTEDSLREAALRYLDKSDASVEQLRRVLRRRIYRYGDRESQEQALLLERVELLLQRFVSSKLLDDTRFARALASSQRRRGGSTLKVRQKLQTRGLSSGDVDDALHWLGEQGEYTEETSAREYVRKRRLREKYDLSDPAQRSRALAALARQGFSYEVAARALLPDEPAD